jgi:hypothetical protein
MSASQVARITGMNHQWLAIFKMLISSDMHSCFCYSDWPGIKVELVMVKFECIDFRGRFYFICPVKGLVELKSTYFHIVFK